MYLLRIGAIKLTWPKAYVQQTGQKINTSVNASSQCSTDTTYDLTYKLYLEGGCTLADAQQLFRDIHNALVTGVVVEQQVRRDAVLETFTLESGTIVPTDFDDVAKSQKAVYRAELSLTVNATGDATFVYPHAQEQFVSGGLNWTSDTFELTPVMEDSTAPTEPQIDDSADFTTLDAFDGGTPGPFTLVAPSVEVDVLGRTVWLVANDIAFNSTNGTRKIIGYVVTRVSDSLPILYISTVPFDPGSVGRFISVAVAL